MTLGYFRTGNFDVEQKENASPVTVADREAEQLIRRMIRERFPGHGILGEEFGTEGENADVTWYIDPIDGTKSFVHGVPLYGTMIGIEVERAPVVGVVYMPALDEMYSAAKGAGAFLNGRPIRVSEHSEIGESVILTTSERSLREHPVYADGYAEICRASKFQRSWGDCYGHMLVASGRAEAMLDPGMAVWDSAPLQTIVEEAGGVFTDWQGNATIHGGSALSTNAHLRAYVAGTLGIPDGRS